MADIREHPSCADCHDAVVSTAASYSRGPEFESHPRDLFFLAHSSIYRVNILKQWALTPTAFANHHS